ncbi:CBO0543 family protein [Metabacillus litoralis]|uniref:CBO0543 family protein n=1 Tax=Metabacillus litoralis TaxID=152268 RepID=UPI001CFD0055|nr:CBO0543 family protein [Metabacillus litoralis]
MKRHFHAALLSFVMPGIGQVHNRQFAKGILLLLLEHFPENKHFLFKFLYYCFHTSIITGFEIFAEKYTTIIRYKNWTWYWSFITIWCSYFLSRIYCKWFFHNESESNY